MEALADGRQEGESTAEYRDRKAAELKKLYTDRKKEARALERAYDKQAKKAKKEYKRTPNEENAQKWAEMQGKATDTAFKGADAQTKEFKVDKIKSKIDWRKQMSEALEILEDIYSAIDKKYPKNSERNKELKDSAYKAKAGAEEVAKEHELGKRPEAAPIKGGWDIRSIEIPDETPEEKEYAKKEWKYDLKQMKKDITKNKAGEHDTKKKQFPKSYKDVGTLGEPDAKELETERVARKAAGKRKAKMNKNEALGLMEDIVSQARKVGKEDKALSTKYKEFYQAADREGLEKVMAKRNVRGTAAGKEDAQIEKSKFLKPLIKKDIERKKAQLAFNKICPAEKVNENEALEILEDIHAAIEKHAHEIKKPRLHRDAIGNYVDELVGVAKNNLPDEKKHLMSATNDEMNKVETKRQNTKNKVGERKTDLRSAGAKGGDYWRVKDQRKEDAAKGYPKAIEKSVKRHEKKMNEALDIIEAIIDFADNLFELDYEEKQNIHPNKISRVKKDKNGEKVEVVSVADELFPYDGDAKQQFNKKVLAKINDMIEGKGSLEDLIQFVRAGAKARAHESLDEAVELLEEILNPDESKKERKNNKQQVYRRMDDPEKGKIGVKKNYNRVIHNDSANKDSAFDYVKIKGTKYRVDKYGEIGAPIQEEKKEPNKECEYRKGEWEKAVQKYFDTKKKHLDWESKHPETRKAYDEERKAYADLDKARRDAKKVYGPYESCEELLEGILDRFKKKDPVYNNPASKELRGKQGKVEQHTDDVVKYTERADKAKGYRKQVNQERAADADKAASQANKEYRHAKGEVLDHFRKRGVSNPHAHKMLSRMMGEGLEELLQTIEGLYTNEAKNIFGKETDRGSLEDDISTTVTGKTLNQHIEDGVKKVTEPKKEA